MGATGQGSAPSPPAFFVAGPNGDHAEIHLQTNSGILSFSAGGLQLTSEKTREALLGKQATSAGLGFRNKAKQAVPPYLSGPTGARVNYLIGDRGNWRTGLKAYAEVVYPDVWPGVAITFRADHHGAPFQVSCNSAADIDSVIFETGADRLTLEPDGALAARFGERIMVIRAPQAWQNADGRRRELPVTLEPKGKGAFGFHLPRETRGKVSLAAEMVWSGFFGNASPVPVDEVRDLAYREVGNEKNYIAVGASNANYLPIPSGLGTGGGMDIMVAVCTQLGRFQSLFFIGGSGDDIAESVALDDSGNVLIAGMTESFDFPVTKNAFDTQYNGDGDAFLLSLPFDFSGIHFGTFLGGGASDAATAVAVRADGQIYVAGNTRSADFPVTTGARGAVKTGQDGFVTRFSGDGSNLSFGDYVGGQGHDTIHSGLLHNDALFLTGGSDSNDFPVTAGTFDLTANGGMDAFALRFDGDTMTWATYLGGEGNDTAHDLAIGADGAVYLAGETTSPNFPLSAGAYDSLLTNTGFGTLLPDAFVTRLDTNGTHLGYSTLLGSHGADRAFGVDVNPEGLVAVTGVGGPDFPVTLGAIVIDSARDRVFTTVLNADGTGLVSSSAHGEGVGNTVLTDDILNGSLIIGGRAERFASQVNLSSPYGNGKAFVTLLRSYDGGYSHGRQFGGSGGFNPWDMVMEASGAVLICGDSASDAVPVRGEPGSIYHDEPMGTDVVLARFHPDGQPDFITFFGGGDYDSASLLTLDPSGNPLIQGLSLSTDLPLSSNRLSDGAEPYYNEYVARLAADGSAVLYSSFIPIFYVSIQDIAADASGRIYVTGNADPNAFTPTPGTVIDEYLPDVWYQAFVFKTNPTGDAVEMGTWLSSREVGTGIAVEVDDSGNIYVAFSDLIDSSSRGWDARVHKLNPEGTGYLYKWGWDSIFLESPIDIALTDTGALWMVNGRRDVSGGWGNAELLVRKLDAQGQLVMNKDLRADGDVAPTDLALVDEDLAFVCGYTDAHDFPATHAAFDTTANGATDAFLAGFSDNGLEYASYLGGSMDDRALAVAANASGEIFVYGSTGSEDFPVTPGAWMTDPGSAFLTRFDYACTPPLAPGPVQGETTLCANAESTFRVDPVPGAEHYAWSLPEDAVIVDGEGTNQVTVRFGETSGDITVAAENNCRGPEQVLEVDLIQPVTAQLWSVSRDCEAGCGYLEVKLTGQGPWELTWSDGFVQSDINTLTVRRQVCPTDITAYSLTSVTTASCTGTVSGTMVVESTSTPTVFIYPRFAPVGLNGARFHANVSCADSVRIDWYQQDAYVETGSFAYISDDLGDEVVVRLNSSRGDELAGDTAYLLVPFDARWTDFNRDGANTVADLQSAAGSWLLEHHADANDDGRVDILDLLYVDTHESFQ